MIEKIKELHSANNIRIEDINYRLIVLKKLKQSINEYEQDIIKALNKDLNKSAKETFLTEINEVLCEIDYHVKNLRKWASDEIVKNTFQTFKCKSFIRYKPKGRVLLIVPFNYPFNLCFMPLIGAISAGNRVLIKLSKQTPNTNIVINKIIKASFLPQHVTCLKNDSLKKYEDLFKYEPNFVFFTGSTDVGKQIQKMCVQRNVEYLLEMGGKCPCFVFEETPSIYRRLVWAKFLNAGQTCVSINYVLYNDKIENFGNKIAEEIKVQFPDTLKNNNIPTIINKKSFERLIKIISEQKNNIIYGGKFDKSKLMIEPTIIETTAKQIKKYGEIFGPILFICKVNDISHAIDISKEIDSSPLAAYLYSNSEEIQEKFISNINAGGYCINDSMLQMLNHNLPFGGVNTSGFGSYHGKQSFLSMSHRKPIVINNQKKDNDIKFINGKYDYHSTKSKINMVKKFIK